MPVIVYMFDKMGTRRFLAHPDGAPIALVNAERAADLLEGVKEFFDLDVPIHAVAQETFGTGSPEADDRPYRLIPTRTAMAYLAFLTASDDSRLRTAKALFNLPST